MRFSCGGVAAFYAARILDGSPPVILYRLRMHEILMHELNIYSVFIQIKPYPYTHTHTHIYIYISPFLFLKPTVEIDGRYIYIYMQESLLMVNDNLGGVYLSASNPACEEALLQNSLSLFLLYIFLTVFFLSLFFFWFNASS
jgi:hypothetical protein